MFAIVRVQLFLRIWHTICFKCIAVSDLDKHASLRFYLVINIFVLHLGRRANERKRRFVICVIKLALLSIRLTCHRLVVHHE